MEGGEGEGWREGRSGRIGKMKEGAEGCGGGGGEVVRHVAVCDVSAASCFCFQF